MSKSPAAPSRRWLRVARFAVTGALLAAIGYLAARYDTISTSAGDDSARPFYDPASTLLLDSFDPLATRGRPHVAYRIAGEQSFRIGRVLARAGQRVSVESSPRGEELRVDGAATGILLRAFDDPQLCAGRVAEDAVFLVSLVPGSAVPDSRTLGPLRRAQLAGRVLLQMPW
ncbi:MAG: hypothetical protein IPN34_03800 [Planctomycetes bacterium]|nr:hypothetical protein [Planctomycetota bacterium]